MSAAAMQSASEPVHLPASSGSYTTSSSSRQYQTAPTQNRDAYYTNQGSYPSTSSRRQGRHNGHAASISSPVSPAAAIDSPYARPLPPSTNNSPQVSVLATASQSRTRSNAADQYDGPPIPPPRTSSQLPKPPAQVPTTNSSVPGAEARNAGTRHKQQNPADDRNYGSRDQNYAAGYSEPIRERPRENTTTAAAAAAQNRRKGGPAPPNEPDRGPSHKVDGHEPSRSQPTGSDAAPPMLRENSEVINRVIVSDPQVDEERIQERVAEARPAPVGTDVTPITGLGLVGSEGVDDGGRGGARRQEFSKSASRRKDVQFGDYMLGQTLGEGEFGKVKLGWKKDGSTQVAIKLIRRESVATNPTRLPKIYREISILRDLAHPNIVRLHEMVETERHIGIILEYASGGELFDFILNHRYLKDQAARRLFAQLVSGVGYLHKKGIVHRDLKLENLLLDQNRNIIITDFGFANTFNPADELSDEIERNLGNRDLVRKYRLDRQDEKGMRKGDLMQTSCGSPCYAAPELVVSDSLYTGRKVDVWSCGVILYAMLAGYLPFDDDPANPEGDNINLLYRYITSTPLTFPEYVTPHARDLLRRILVPDPRRRADLFEVARHSWLSEYHHVVSHITSSTTNITDIQNTTIPHEDSPTGQHLNRSASVREPAKTPTTTSPVGVMTHNLAQIKLGEIPDYSRSQRDKATRHTLQPEYVAPQSHTTRSDLVGTAITPAPPSEMVRASRGHTKPVTQTASRSKPLPQDPPSDSGKVADYVSTQTSQQMMPPPPPSRPAREMPHSASVTTGTFGVPPAQSTSYPQVTRPSTSGSMPSANETHSDIRLPSRGSYGQPVAPTVAATNAEGRVTQPKNNRGYNISDPLSAHTHQASLDQPGPHMPLTSFNQTPAAPPPQQPKRGHTRTSSTFSGLGERIFGRSASTAKRQDGDAHRHRNGRKYPPVSLKNQYPADNTHRTSIDSKRSFSLGFGRKRSTDLESQEDKPSRRFSLIPPSMSFKGLIGSNREQGAEIEPPMSQISNFSQPTMSHVQSRPATGHHTAGSYEPQEGLSAGHDGQHDQQPSAKVNFSRPPQSYQQHQQPSSQAPNDVYGSTGVYAPNNPYPDRSYPVGPTPPAEANYRRLNPPRPQYPDGFNSYDQSRPSIQLGRGGKNVLQKNNRKFVDSYNNEHGPTHHEGSSGPAKKVMDFFRRRGRARVDDFH